MMVGKDDHLGLSLSLSSASAADADHRRRLPLQLNLMPSPSPFFLPEKAAAPWTDLLAPPPPAPGERGLRGIDVNRAPAGERESEEDGGGASSPNSTLSSVSGKRGRSSDRDLDPAAPAGSDDHDHDHEADPACSSRGGGGIASDEEDGGDGSRKKLRLSKDQSAILEESFKEHNTLNPKQKLALAKQLNLRPRQVEVWFQNRRARTKLKQTEVDCEFLKRCCENLTEENRRLQKEVQELRALKLSPQFYMHMTPPTTLTMCPSCERVSSSSSAAAAAPQPNAAPAAPPVMASADFLYSHHQQQQQHRKAGQAAAAAAPWAPVPLRAVPFLDAAAAAAAAQR